MNVEYKAKYLRVLLEKVQDDHYPSTTHMAMIEQALPAEWIPQYLDVLLEKIADDPHPSIDMLRRIDRLVEAAPSRKR